MFSLRTCTICVLTSLSLPIFTAVTSETAYILATGGVEGAISLEVPGTLHQGEETTVNYSNPDLAGQTVTIDVDDGGTQTDQIQITLDANGNGTGTWVPPSGWDLANFNAPDAQEVTKGVHSGN